MDPSKEGAKRPAHTPTPKSIGTLQARSTSLRLLWAHPCVPAFGAFKSPAGLRVSAGGKPGVAWLTNAQVWGLPADSGRKACYAPSSPGPSTATV